MKTLDAFEGDRAGGIASASGGGEDGSGFVIESVEMRDFMGYSSAAERLEFDVKFMVITGRTGAGKTTILDAVTFALFGRTSRTDAGVTREGICRPGGYVELAFSQAGRRYVVRRGSKSKTLSTLSVREDGELLEGNIRELDAIIERVIGFDYEGFKNATFVRQDEMRTLGSKKSSERLAIFQRLFRLDVFEKARQQADARLREVSLGLEATRGAMRAKGEALARRPEVQGHLDEAAKELKGLAASIREAKEKFESLKGELEASKKDYEELIGAESKLKAAQRRLAALDGDVAKAKQALADGSARKSEMKRLQEEVGGLDELRTEMDKLKAAAAKANALGKELAERKRAMDAASRRHALERRRLESKLAEEMRRLDGARTTLDKDEAFELLRSEGRLGERLERIEKEMAWLSDRKDIVSELKEEKAASQKEAKRVSKLAGQINEDSFALGEMRRNVEKAKEAIEAAAKRGEKELAELDGRVSATLKKLDELGFDDAAAARLDEASRRLGELEAKKRKLDRLTREEAERGDLRAKLAELARQRDAAREETEAASAALEPMAGRKRLYEEMGEALEAARERLAGLEKAQARAEERRDGFTARLRELDGLEGELASLRDEAANGEGLVSVYSVLKDSVFHLKGITMYAIQHLLPQLEIESSALLSDLTAGRFTKVRLALLEEKREYGVRIEVCGVDGAWHDVSEFSGGERTQINAALRFAISRELASMPHVGKTYGRMRTLFIDEGDLGSLDTEVSRELFVNKLFEMGSYFERIILITHLDEVADRFPARARVAQGEGGASHIARGEG